MIVAALAKLEANAPDVARTLLVFANEHRFRILCRLAANKKELSFTALADGIQISQSAHSQHLIKLRKGKVISTRRAGHNCFYRLSDPRALKLAIGLQKILNGAWRTP
jgi:ArsR family transcriptional regulator, virulence genes transcriptional regulator